MAMIQGIDGSALIQAFRAGRGDRYASEKQLAELQEAEAERARRQEFSGLVGQLFGDRQAPTVASNYSPEPASVPSTFAEAFTPGTMGAISRGENPDAAPAPTMPTQAPRRTPNPEVLTQLILLDPEAGGQIASALKSMDEMDLKRVEARNNFMGAAARYVAQGRTPEERLQRFQIATPQLLEAGYTPEELDGIDNDLSDQRLQFYMATAIDYDKLLDNELAEREFNAGRTVPVVPGGSVALVRPDGSAEYVIGGGGQPAPVPQIATTEDYEALAPGMEYLDPDGNRRRKPGGGVGDGTGGF